jgi:hypothetical protein
MAAYVDALFRLESKNPQAFALGQKTGHRWCHLWADSEEELHTFAALLGMRRSWVHVTSLAHYDLTPNKRAQALRHGALESTVPTWRRAQACGPTASAS